MSFSNNSELENADRNLDALNSIVRALLSLPEEQRWRAVESACSWVGIDVQSKSGLKPSATSYSQSTPTFRVNTAEQTLGFSDRASLAPKEFMLNKEPQTDVERVACLAFYLTHYRDSAHFKTVDLSELNTEAAQPKFSNPSQAVINADKGGYLVSAPGGQKQLSSLGEQYVLALPDREAARASTERMRKRKSKKVLRKKPV